MSLNTTLRVLYQGQRHDVYPKTTIAKVDGLSSRLSTIESDVSTNTTSIGTLNTSISSLSSRMTTAEGSITSLQSGKADKEHTHVGSQIYVKSEELGTRLNEWATSIENELSDLAGGLQYKGVFTTDATLQALLEATTSKAGSYFVYNGSSAYTIPASLGGKTITIVYGDDGSSTERVIEKNDYVVLNEKLTGEYKISIINNTHGSATTSKVGLVKLATGASTGNEVITASVLNSKNYQPAGSYANLGNNNVFTGTNTFSNDVLLNHTTSGKKFQINIGQQGSANIVVSPGGNPEQSTTTLLLQPTLAGGDETIIHTGNISLYAKKGMPLLTSAQESSFTTENVIYAVLDA